MKKWYIGAGVVVVAIGVLLAKRPGGEEPSVTVAMASLDIMPREVKTAPKVVREAYQFAVANPTVLKEVPCYCGCGGMGHTSNYSCYVTEVPDGRAQFDGHALGCSICVDIALDTKRLMEKGASLPEMRLYVDATYSKYGPSNM